MMGVRDLQRSFRFDMVLLVVVLLLGCGRVEAFRKFKGRFPAEGRSRPTASASHRTPTFETDPYEEQRRRELLRPTSPQQHLVKSLPFLEEGAFPSAHYAGHLPASPRDSADPDDKALFYWLFAPDGTDTEYDESEYEDDAPLVIWLNGGPGCSSMTGLFLEHGPFRLVTTGNDSESDNDSDTDTNSEAGPGPAGPDPTADADAPTWKMEVNPYSWHTAPAWMLYVDQPVGAGLSFTREGNYCTSQDEINVDFYTWFYEFLWLHRDTMLQPIQTGGWELQRDLFFTGESHAGIYIPSFMDYILKQNQVISSRPTGLTDKDILITITGAAIGNGSMDPYTQYNPTSTLYGLGFVDLAQKQYADDAEKICQNLLDAGGRPIDNGQTKKNNKAVNEELLDAASQCLEDLWDVTEDIVDQAAGDTANIKLSFYNAEYWEVKGESRAYPPGHKVLEAYLGGWDLMDDLPPMNTYPSILENIHATQTLQVDQRYEECSAEAYNALEETDYEWIRGVTSEVERILKNYPDIRLLFYNGMLDLMCDHSGVERWLDRLNWDGHDEFVSAWRYGWTPQYEGPPVAYAKESRQLGFLKIKNAGHFVPLEQPYVALEMIRRMVHGFYFRGYGGQDLSANDPEELKEGERCPICQDCDAIVDKAVSAARIEDAASANQSKIATTNKNTVKVNNDDNNSKVNTNVDTVNNVDDQYFDDDGVSMWLWICGSVVLMCLAFDVGRRRRAKPYDPVALNNGMEGRNEFMDDEDARLT